MQLYGNEFSPSLKISSSGQKLVHFFIRINTKIIEKIIYQITRYMSTTLFRFRQDLRLSDNTGLIQAIKDSEQIVPVFVFDTDILSKFPEHDDRLAFLIEAVQDLEKQLHVVWYNLIITVGKSSELIPQIIQEYACKALYHNKSYGFGSLSRDKQMEQRCNQNQVTYRSFADFLLVEPEAVDVRKVFTPFYKLRQKIEKKTVDTTVIHSHMNNQTKANDRDQIISHLSPGTNTHRPIDGWKKRLELNLQSYDTTRNELPNDGTTKLAPYIRFGLVSIRQVYRHYQALSQTSKSQLNNSDTEITDWHSVIISELARREFWHHISYHFPESRLVSFQEKRRHIARENKEMEFAARCEGRTGYPIVDAAMKQLVQEKWMHNRARMIVASFLTKDCLIDRTWWEAFFAKHLLDYDSNVNIGNRQRAASVWADPKPLRIFSPILQAQRFDPQATYIKKYLPELADIDAYRLHDPLTYRIPYHTPIVDHAFAQRRARERYKE